MIQAPNLPEWAALLVGILLLGGATFTLIGAIGLVTLKSYYERVHAASLGPTMGAILILASSIICFSVLQSRPVVHEILIFVFITVTTPVTMMLISRASIYRDRIEQNADVPVDVKSAPKDPTEPQ